MLAKCHTECFDGPKCWRYSPEGGANGDGIYDIDPMNPIAAYFDFPKGTKKYSKKYGTIIEGGEPPPEDDEEETIEKAPDFTKKQLQAELDKLGVKWTPIMNKDTLKNMLIQAQV